MMPRFIVASLALSPFVGAACTSFSVDAPAANEMDAGSDAPSRSDADDADALTRPSDAGPLRRLFVIGGAIDQGSTEKTYVGSIDPGGAITWRGGPSLSTALANGCAAAVGDRIHFVGGTENSGAIPPGALMRPDDVAPKWTDDVAPAESRILQGCAVDHDRLYVTGGSKGEAGPMMTTEVAAAGVDGRFQWSAGTNLLEGLQGHGAAIVSGRLFAIGNSFPCDSQISSASILTDGGLTAWVDAGSLPASRSEAAVVSGADRIYIVGGLRGPMPCGQPSGSIDVLLIDPTTGLIKGATAERLLPETRTSHMATIVGGRLYVLGGNAGASRSLTRSVISAVVLPDQSLGAWREESNLPVALSRFGLAVY